MIEITLTLFLFLLFLVWLTHGPSLFFSNRPKGGKRPVSFLHKLAAALGVLLLLGTAWTTWRDQGPSLPPAPRGELHAPFRLLGSSPSRPITVEPGETKAFLFQAFLAVLLEDGLHPVSVREKKVLRPKGKPLFVPFQFALGENTLSFLAELSEHRPSRPAGRPQDIPRKGRKSEAAEPLDVTWDFGWNQPNYGSVTTTTRLEGRPSFFWSNLGWRRESSSLERAFSLHPAPPLPYVFLVVLLPLREGETLAPIKGEDLQAYFRILRALGTEGTYSTANSVKACSWKWLPSSLPLTSRPQEEGAEIPPPGFPALAAFLPSTLLLLLALALLSQVFPRRYPLFLLLALLSLTALAGLDRARLGRTLKVLQDPKAPMAARLLAAHKMEGTFFFRKTAAQNAKALARDPNLPAPLHQALSALYQPKTGPESR